MIGGRGNDIYRVDHAGDIVTELAGAGTDTVQTAVSYTLGATLENLQLLDGAAVGVGNAVDNLLYGHDGADRLEGLAGNDTLFDADEVADTLLGGAGNDVYVVDATDVITENANEGTDEVDVAADYTLGANLENLRLLQTDGLPAAFAATGNTLVNMLWGNDDDNVLDGGTGKDKLLGGKGNDTYIVDDSGDTLTENAGEGIDTVKTALAAWTLGANVENLTMLDGTAASQGTGNALDNVLRGNAGANTFNGAAGNDTLFGGRGADILTGGTGSDLFCFGAADQATDTVKDFTSKTDQLVFLGTDFGGLAAGAPGTGQFVSAKGNHNATQAGPQFLYDISTGGLWFDADGTGAQAAWQVATLSNKAALVATDLLIVDTFF
jgi:Ca2+-binding RTX toxin-like protein